MTKPLYSVKVALVRALTHALELCWSSITFATAYELQIQKIEPTSLIPTTKVAAANMQSSPISNNQNNVGSSSTNSSVNTSPVTPQTSSPNIKCQKTPPTTSTVQPNAASPNLVNTSAQLVARGQTQNYITTNQNAIFIAQAGTARSPQTNTKIISEAGCIENTASKVNHSSNITILQKFRPANVVSKTCTITSTVNCSPVSSLSTSMVQTSVTNSIGDSSNIRVVNSTSTSPVSCIQQPTPSVRVLTTAAGNPAQALRVASNTTGEFFSFFFFVKCYSS